jgi:glycine cleavage system regulatory protein
MRDIAGTLPAVTLYKPSGRYTQHPSYTDLESGDIHMAELLEKLRASPQWNDMLVILTYDENGGYWDHVPPPTGTGWGDRWGPGTRIPSLIIGPHVKRGYIDSTSYDTTSTLKFITRRFNLEPLPGVRKSRRLDERAAIADVVHMNPMLDSLVVTVIGPDRPGLVSLISDRGRAHGASWDEPDGEPGRTVRWHRSFRRSARPGGRIDRSAAATGSSGLRVTVVAGDVVEDAPGGRTLELELVGQDRPGIVRDISRALAELGISIRELETEVSSAAMSGEHLFTARAVLQVPRDIATAELRGVLEALANELMVDVELDEARHG